MGRHTAEQQNENQDTTEGLIRSMMVEQKAESSRASLPDLAPVEHGEFDRPAAAKEHSKARKATVAPRRRSTGSIQHLKAKILAYRPTRSHILWALVLLVVIWSPWLIPGLLFVAFWVALIAYLTVGYDRMMEWLSSAWYRLGEANPDLIEKLRTRADAFALRFDAFLDRLPESWAEKLALPDMSAQRAEQDALDDRPDPFDRLKTPEVYRG